MKQRLTVTICAYNHEAYIGKALDRLAEQTFQDFKIVASDDGSTDGTYRILKEYEAGRLAGKLKVVTHPGHVNRGIHHSINLVLQHVDTEFFFGQASDDFLEPDALEYLLNLLDQNPSIDFLYGQVNVVDERGEDLFYYSGTEDIGSGLKAAERLLLSNPVRAPSMFYRISCKEYLEAVPPDLVSGDLYHNFFLFLEKAPLYYKKPAVNYRVHSSNVSIVIPIDVLWQRRMDVFAALYKHPRISIHPSLAFGCLSLLQAYGRLRQSVTEASVAANSLLGGIPSKKRKKQLLVESWKNAESIEVGRGCLFLRILPWHLGVMLLARIGPVAACDSSARYIRRASFRDKARLLGQLLSSLFVGILVMAKDYLRVIASPFRS